MKRGTSYHEGLEVEKDGEVYYVDVKVEWSESEPVHTSWDGSPGTDGHQDFDFKIEYVCRDNEDGECIPVPKDEWELMEDWVHHKLYSMDWSTLTS